MNEKEQQLVMLFPENYRTALKSVSLIKLKTKYKIDGTKIQEAFNVIVNISPSAYYPAGKSIVLCKLCDGMLYVPDSGETVYLSDLEAARDMLVRCIKASCSTGSFGCCSQYEKCSDNGRCVHENPFYSLGCIYRSHLENGEIFYGINRNVEHRKGDREMKRCIRCGRTSIFLKLKNGLCTSCQNAVDEENRRQCISETSHFDPAANENFNVVDVETPNNNNDRICSISISRVSNASILWTKSYLVNPEVSFCSRNESLTGITQEMVRNSPTFPHLWDEINKYLQEGVFVAHNARFDLNVLYKCLQYYGITYGPIRYIDTMELAQRAFPELPHYGLHDICSIMNVPLKHHCSESDSFACASILKHCISEGIDVMAYKHTFEPNRSDCEKKKTKSLRSTHVSANTLQMNTLLSLVKSVCRDGRVTEDEIDQLRCWIDEHQELSKEFPYALIQSSIEESLSDGVLEPLELQQLFETFLFLLDPLGATFPCDNVDFTNKIICLSGNFDYGTKEEVEKLLESMGATIHPRVTSKLNYLIVGNQASNEWSFGQYGHKIKQAIQLQMKGKPVKILKEADFMAAIQKNL